MPTTTPATPTRRSPHPGWGGDLRGYLVNPATQLLWRPDGTLQLELGARAVVIEGAAAQVVRQLAATRTAARTTSRGGARPRARASSLARITSRSGTTASAAATLAATRTPARTATPAMALVPRSARPELRALVAAGYLLAPDHGARGGSDGAATIGTVRGHGPVEGPDGDPDTPLAPHLASELRALTARHGLDAAELLGTRRHLSVVVRGGNRAGPLVAALLAASGVGRVHVGEARATRLHQSLPGGVLPGDEGTPFSAAAGEAILRAAPDTDLRPPLSRERPDLVVLAYDEPVDPDHRDALHAADQAHLLVRLAADYGVVGPLVIPGLTSCLHCADLHRLDRDPAWTALAVQLATPRRTGPVPPTALATVIAGVAAQQALAYLDGGQPAVIDGTIEQHLPDWRLRRRSWPIHPDCDCAGTRALRVM